ncbi:MAG: diaminopimelate decarboxylase [Verrucomicrobia bacterium]|jgi:diaminopimelate decarboxylase|nr:MAG: diaminopimelate decarboxylase [Verrucomicrobiota bacterium]
MHSFHYRNGDLCCEGVALQSLADQYGSPLYVYSAATIRDHFLRLDASLSGLDHLICYATKANSNLAILNLLAKLGSGFDIVSAGELYRVKQAGGDPGKCTFAGVGKTRPEIEFALKEGIYCFNAESEAEVRFISNIAADLGVTAPVALRVNPNVDAHTHKYISTGKSENKFGIDFALIREAYQRAASLPNLQIRGLQMHIGSQLTSVQPFLEAVEKVAPLAADLKRDYGIEFWSIGGGIGIVYQQSLASGRPDWWSAPESGVSPLTIESYASSLLPTLRSLGLRILLEPGRFLVGNAGVLITRVVYEKRGTAKTFKIVDAGMNDLIRPALYQGHHEVVPLREPAPGAQFETVDVVGPVCESGDFFAQDRSVPPLAAGDCLALMSSGAYGFVMASNYNSRPLPAEVLVDGESAHLVRRRQEFADLIAGELIPA